MESDAELAARAKSGDDSAFDVLVKRHLGSVYAFLARYMGDEARAEDATQETFVKAWRAMKRFDETRAMRPWLFEIGRNAANDILRRKHATPFSAFKRDDADLGLEDTLDDPAPLPPELFEQKELGKHVAEALATLPDRDRAVLLLRYYEELAFEDVARIMESPLNTVKSWHRRALHKLRNRLAPYHKP